VRFGHQRIHVWFMTKCTMHWELQCGSPSQVMICCWVQSSLYVVFIDYKRAFDSLNRECIWKELKARGLPSKFLNLINESYNSFSCRIYHNGHLSEPFLLLCADQHLSGNSWKITYCV
jgi:hypothetical protein